MTEVKIPERHFARSLYETKSKSDLCTFLHLALWSPCTSTLISAIKTTFFPHGQESPNNSSKNSSKNPKPPRKGIFGNPTKESSQHIPRNQMKRRVKIQLAHTEFFYKQPIFQGKFVNNLKQNNRHIPRNQMKRRVISQLARTVFIYRRSIYQEKFTQIKPADSPSRQAAVSNKWSPMTTTPTKFMPNP